MATLKTLVVQKILQITIAICQKLNLFSPVYGRTDLRSDLRSEMNYMITFNLDRFSPDHNEEEDEDRLKYLRKKFKLNSTSTTKKEVILYVLKYQANLVSLPVELPNVVRTQFSLL